jgi:hypothetical protein
MDTTTRRTPNTSIVRRQLLKGAAAAGILAALQVPELAHAVEADAATPSLVGAWIVQIDSGGMHSVDLTSFTKDGLVFDAGSLPLKAPAPGQGGPPSVGLGAWAAAKGGGFDATFVNLAPDPKGAFALTVTINAHVSLGAGGNTFSGAFTVTGESGGKVMFSDKGTVTAKRIKARPM